MKPGQKVVVALRKMIATGEIPAGARIAEIPTAETLGVSRMPVRTALRALEQEGLVMRLGARGYAARSISPGQIRDALEVRGVLEGFAARRAAERGVDAPTRQRFQALLETGDALFATGKLREADLERYTAYNIAFHDLLVAAAGNEAIAQSLARNGFQPFAGAGAFALDYGDLETEYAHLLAAHRQHRRAFQAIEAGDGELAERIMRDHALAAIRNGRVFEQAMPPPAEGRPAPASTARLAASRRAGKVDQSLIDLIGGAARNGSQDRAGPYIKRSGEGEL